MARHQRTRSMDLADTVRHIESRGQSARDPETGCLVWQGSRHPSGAGQIRYQGRLHYCHRLVLERYHGPSRGRRARRSCSDPACVDIRHLAWGANATRAEQDAARSRMETDMARDAREAREEDRERDAARRARRRRSALSRYRSARRDAEQRRTRDQLQRTVDAEPWDTPDPAIRRAKLDDWRQDADGTQTGPETVH